MADKDNRNNTNRKSNVRSRNSANVNRSSRRVKKYRTKKSMVVKMVLLVILFAFSNILAFAAWWLLSLWSNLTMDEIVYHLSTTIEGTNPDMIVEAIVKYALPAALIILAFIGLLVFMGKKRMNRKPVMLLALIISVVEIFGTVYALEKKLQVIEYVKDGGSYSTFIDDHYVDPKETKITFPKKKRNLIFLYLESMEATYADKAAGGADMWGKSLIPELTELSKEAEDFSGSDTSKLNGAWSMSGATWTMGGIFAMTTGLPLKISINRNAMNLMNHFFNKTTALGDILKENGYTQYFLCGSDVNFGGRALYFKDHGDYICHDYYYAIKRGWIPEDYHVFWGYEDQKLYANAKKDLTEIAAKGEPFNYTMLTVDTHAEDGYVCELCGKDFGDNQYANVIHCADKQAAEFIRWLQQQDFYENTTVIINGDHYTMDNNFFSDLEPGFVRRTYTAYLNAPVTPSQDKHRIYNTMDNFPTTLAAMGCKIEGERLGLGTNLFSDKKTLLEECGTDVVDVELKKSSKLVDEMADIENVKSNMIDNVRKQTTFSYGLPDVPKDGIRVIMNMGYSYDPEEIKAAVMMVFPNNAREAVRLMPMKVSHDYGGQNVFMADVDIYDLMGTGFNAVTRITLDTDKQYFIHGSFVDYIGTRYIVLNENQ